MSQIAWGSLKKKSVFIAQQQKNKHNFFRSGLLLPNWVCHFIQDIQFDELVFQIHRVLLPPAGDSSTRQSLAFFVQPDDDYLITCCDGSNKYPAVKSGDYLNHRLAVAHRDSWTLAKAVPN